MKVKEPGLLVVALLGAVVIGWGCWVATQTTRKQIRDRSLVREAIDNAKSVTIVVVGKTRILDVASNSNVLNSFHDAVLYPSVPPSPGVHPAAVLKVGGETLSYVSATGQIGLDRRDGRREWFTLPQPARGRIEGVVEYLAANRVAKAGDDGAE